MFHFIDCIFIEICQPGQRNIIIGCVYRPPNTDQTLFNSEMITLLNMLDSEKNKLILLSGDFNADLLNHANHALTGDFLNAMLSHLMYPVIRNPTRVTEKSSTLIDNIFINCSQNVFEAVIICNDLSDHFPVAAITLETKNNKRKFESLTKKRVFDSKSTQTF